MKILVDADACPNAIKNILYKVPSRVKVNIIFFANQSLNIPKLPGLSFKLVSKGFDVADQEIEAMVEAGDIVITADLPLANAVIEKQGIAINVRGTLYTTENIKQKLAMRNFMTDLRDSGQRVGGPSAFSKKDIQNFANSLDRLLAQKH